MGATVFEVGVSLFLGAQSLPDADKQEASTRWTVVDEMRQSILIEANDFIPDTQGDPLDNYYSRSHRRHEPLPLVIGGSDGSGTRALVDIIAQLGVPMVVDDKGTMDMHAGFLFQKQGWPPMVDLVLKHADASKKYYNVEDLPQEVLNRVENELTKLGMFLDTRSKMAITRNFSRETATNVQYGFKAPVSMMLLPLFLKYLWPTTGFKYLHVVRDGRDVALSNNQSPVQKFYRQAYPDAQTRMRKYHSLAPVMAMQLWNDWNIGVYEWLLQQTKIDFLVVRSEDLLYSKFETLARLADFVGSPRSPEELCCLSLETTKDLGTSAVSGRRWQFFPGLVDPMTSALLRTHSKSFPTRPRYTTLKQLREHKKKIIEEVEGRAEAKAREQSRRRLWGWFFDLDEDLGKLVVKQIQSLDRYNPAESSVSHRYGKWARLLHRNPQLSQAMHEHGRRALQAFGYKPRRRFMDASDLRCDIEGTICTEVTNATSI
jgi:hypothetical protein